MSYRRRGLGLTAAEQARANQLNEEQGVVRFTVSPGTLSPWLDAALVPRGIPAEEAGRVLTAVREVLQSAGDRVERVVWGGGAGLESVAGKVYVRWQPGRPANAVTYADIMRRLFQSVAGQFPAGAQLIMPRYRIVAAALSPFPDRYVYPQGGPIPAGAPEAARRTTMEDIPLDPTVGDVAEGGVRVGIGIAAGVGVAVVLGGGYWYWSKNKRR